jgi:hypothetical protein
MKYLVSRDVSLGINRLYIVSPPSIASPALFHESLTMQTTNSQTYVASRKIS